MTSKTASRYRSLQLLAATALLPSACALAAPPSTALSVSDVIQTQRGPTRITAKFHASMQIEFAGKVIDIDPVSAGSYNRKADLILITHAHGDHFDPAAIKKIAAAGAQIIAPRSIARRLTPTMKPGLVVPLDNGSKVYWSTRPKNLRAARGADVRIEAVPMYNLARGPKPGQKFHPKGDGNGYILTLGGKRIYIAGDTEATPAMWQLKNIDIAFLPMNLPFTMTPQEAATGARAFKPRLVYPYHHRYPFDKPNSNTQQFAAALRGSGVQVRLLDWYPAAAVARAMTSN